MAGRPVRAGRAARPSGARRDFNTARDQLLALANGLNRLQAGAGDEVLKQAALQLQQVRRRALSSFPGSESWAS